MRTTAPALRRRNHAQRLSNQRWLARRHAQQGNDTDTDGDESDSDDFARPKTIRKRVPPKSLGRRDESHEGHSGDDHSGEASGEDDSDGIDSGDDSDDNALTSTRPAPAATQRPSPATLPGGGLAAVAAGTPRGGAVLVTPSAAPSRAAPVLAAPPLAAPSRAASSRAAAPAPTNTASLGTGVGSGLGIVVLPPPNAATPPGTGAVAVPPGASGLPGSTLGAAEDELTSASDSDGIESGDPSDSDSADSADSEDEKTTTTTQSSPSTTASASRIGASPTGPVTLIAPTPTDFVVTPPRLSSLPPIAAAPVATNGPGNLPTYALPDNSPEPTTGLGNLRGGEDSAPNDGVTAESTRPNAGTAAGIVIGVIALIALFVGLAFTWRKLKRDGKAMPPLPLFWRKSEKHDEYPADIKRDYDPDMIPILPPPQTYQQESKKTDSDMMNMLMKATFKAENGDRSTQSTLPDISNRAVASSDFSQRAVDNVGPGFVQQQAAVPRGPGFMDETAYTALAGPPTPAPTKPVQRWLEDVKTPRSSVGGDQAPVQWPVSAVPPMPTMQVPFRADEVPVGKPRDDQFLPPAPAYAQNSRYTTTTATSSSTEDFWFRK